MLSGIVYVNSNTPSSDTAIRIAIGTSAVNGEEQTITDDNTAPTGVSWSTAANSGSALSMGTIPWSGHRAVWVERVVTAGAAAANDDNYTLIYAGETSA